MRSDTETLLLDEIHRRLRVAIPKAVPIVGADDIDELVQDGMVIAIVLLKSAKKAGKKVTAANIAYYTICLCRSLL